MAKISINFLNNPLDVYDAVPASTCGDQPLLQLLDNARLCDLATRRASELPHK